MYFEVSYARVRQNASQAILAESLDGSPTSRRAGSSFQRQDAGGVVATALGGIMKSVCHGREAQRLRAARIVPIPARESRAEPVAEHNIGGVLTVIAKF